jgi:ribonuclease HII
VVLPDGKRGIVPGLNDSKLLTPARREACYEQSVSARSPGQQWCCPQQL